VQGRGGPLEDDELLVAVADGVDVVAVVVVGVIVTVVVVVTVVVDVVPGVPADDEAAVDVEAPLGLAALDGDALDEVAFAVDSPPAVPLLSECASPLTVVVAIAPRLVVGSPPSSVWNVASGNAQARAQRGAQATTTRRAILTRRPRGSMGSRPPRAAQGATGAARLPRGKRARLGMGRR
jgi:hypothetical protein